MPDCIPHVTLTYAQSLDSQLSLAPGQRTTLSGLQTKAMTHYLRANHDAILIGVGTANVDNPGLNCSFSYDGEKIVELAEQPRPLILDPGRSWKEEKCEKLFNLARTGLGRAPWWIVCEDSVEKGKVREGDEERIRKIKGIGGDVITVGRYANREDGVEWDKILRALGNTGIRSVMIEGGATVINDLLRARNQYLVSSVIVTIAPTYLGSGGVVVVPPRSKPDENEARLRGVTWIPFGQDVVMAGQLAPN
jgi:2,5-diamino-6-(ribosylamino)-4(3H)-pyrimidinone 5'-phosphate reductase